MSVWVECGVTTSQHPIMSFCLKQEGEGGRAVSHGRRAWSLTDSLSPVALPFTHVSARFEAKARGLGKGSKQVLGAQSGIAKMSSKQHLCHIKNLHVGACGRASVRPIHWHSHEEKMQLWHQTSIGWKRMEGKTRHTHSQSLLTSFPNARKDICSFIACVYYVFLSQLGFPGDLINE